MLFNVFNGWGIVQWWYLCDFKGLLFMGEFSNRWDMPSNSLKSTLWIGRESLGGCPGCSAGCSRGVGISFHFLFWLGDVCFQVLLFWILWFRCLPITFWDVGPVGHVLDNFWNWHPWIFLTWPTFGMFVEGDFLGTIFLVRDSGYNSYPRYGNDATKYLTSYHFCHTLDHFHLLNCQI
jgi:hypothetical protein